MQVETKTCVMHPRAVTREMVNAAVKVHTKICGAIYGGVVRGILNFAVGKNGRQSDKRLVNRVRDEALRNVKPREYGEKAPEVYGDPEDYDPVLRAHCRLDREYRLWAAYEPTSAGRPT
jgi:hypothetical protein